VQSECRRSEAEREDSEVEAVVMIPVTVSSYDLIVPICEALDLGDPNLIRQLTIKPALVEVDIFLLNENGMKYVNLATGLPATEKRVFKVNP
jgi:hypothetical protein